MSNWYKLTFSLAAKLAPFIKCYLFTIILGELIVFWCDHYLCEDNPALCGILVLDSLHWTQCFKTLRIHEIAFSLLENMIWFCLRFVLVLWGILEEHKFQISLTSCKNNTNKQETLEARLWENSWGQCFPCFQKRLKLFLWGL